MNETHMDKKAHTKEAPEMVEITRVEKETPEHITFYFKNKKTSLATPGQFLMVWLPRIDEKPISFSQIGKECAITVQNKGVWSSQMGALKAGGFIGIRGPY